MTITCQNKRKRFLTRFFSSCPLQNSILPPRLARKLQIFQKKLRAPSTILLYCSPYQNRRFYILFVKIKRKFTDLEQINNKFIIYFLERWDDGTMGRVARSSILYQQWCLFSTPVSNTVYVTSRLCYNEHHLHLIS